MKILIDIPKQTFDEVLNTVAYNLFGEVIQIIVDGEVISEEEGRMNLLQTQNIIADDSFQYGGNSFEMFDIVDAIKDGYRLCKVDDLINTVNKDERINCVGMGYHVIKLIREACE